MSVASSQESGEVSSLKIIIDLLQEKYGPITYGMVMLLILWFFVVQPEVRRLQVDYTAQQELLQALTDRDRAQEKIADSMSDTAQTMSVTAAILERAVQRLQDQERTNGG